MPTELPSRGRVAGCMCVALVSITSARFSPTTLRSAVTPSLARWALSPATNVQQNASHRLRSTAATRALGHAKLCHPATRVRRNLCAQRTVPNIRKFPWQSATTTRLHVVRILNWYKRYWCALNFELLRCRAFEKRQCSRRRNDACLAVCKDVPATVPMWAKPQRHEPDLH